MVIEELLYISDCTHCGGPSILEEEASGYYVMCMDCGRYSVNVGYKSPSDEDRLDAARRTVELWNGGKTISSSPGE